MNVEINLRGYQSYGTKKVKYRKLGIITYNLVITETKTQVTYSFTNGNVLVVIPKADKVAFEKARKASLACTNVDELA